MNEVAPALHTRSKLQDVFKTSDQGRNFGDDVLLYTAVDDPEYVEFINSLRDPSKYIQDGNSLFGSDVIVGSSF